jgi:hypothetical protein
MPERALRGSCLCKSVRYEVRPPFLRFAHCYCSRCRKATGGVRSTNIAVAPEGFRWISGEELISRYDLPEARSFATAICKRCNGPVPRPSRDRERVIVPAGTLDDDPPGRPTAHRFWSSRASWASLDESDLPCED